MHNNNKNLDLKKFTRINKNLLISNSDKRNNPEKWLKYFPNDADAIYFLAEKQFKEKKYEDSLINYQKAIDCKSNYSKDAKYKIIATKQKIKEIKRKQLLESIKSSLIIFLLVILFFLFSNFILYYFIDKYIFLQNNNEVSKLINTENFNKIAVQEDILRYTIIPKRKTEKEVIEEITKVLKKKKIQYPDNKISVKATLPNGDVFEGILNNINSEPLIYKNGKLVKKDNIFSQPTTKTKEMYIEKDLIDFEMLILRSALYSYIKNNKTFPESLEELAMPYPRNYLSSIPKLIPYKEYPFEDDWIYNKPNLTSPLTEENIKQKIEKSLKANVKNYIPEKFISPIELVLYKNTKTLVLKGNGEILKVYPVGIGKKGKETPEGVFYIRKKIINPKHSSGKNVYGTRGLEFADNYAIHGTENGVIRDTIGCVAMNKEDIEELYSIVPLGTKLTIKKNNNDNFIPNNINPNNKNSNNESSKKKSIPLDKNVDKNGIKKIIPTNSNKEQTNSVFNWKNMI